MVDDSTSEGPISIFGKLVVVRSAMLKKRRDIMETVVKNMAKEKEETEKWKEESWTSGGKAAAKMPTGVAVMVADNVSTITEPTNGGATALTTDEDDVVIVSVLVVSVSV